MRLPTKEDVQLHFANCTSMLIESNPIYASLEVGLSGLTPEESMNARAMVTLLTYFGLGSVFAGGREYSKRKCNVTKYSPESLHKKHDFWYSFAFNLAVTPPLYMLSQLAAGEPIDACTIVKGSFFAAGFGAANGVFIGYAIDAGKDLLGLEECKRKSYPQKMKSLGVNAKRWIYAGALVTSMGLMAGAYALAPEKQEVHSSHALIEDRLSTYAPDSLELIVREEMH